MALPARASHADRPARWRSGQRQPVVVGEAERFGFSVSDVEQRCGRFGGLPAFRALQVLAAEGLGGFLTFDAASFGPLEPIMARAGSEARSRSSSIFYCGAGALGWRRGC